MKWTKEQENVIKKRGGNLLVSAAAGSGKTAVLVQRIIEMIMDKERPVDIDKLLVVTFTKAAAAQMKERIQEAIERELKKNPANDHLIRQMSLIHKAQITTIHSFCLSVIRSHFHQVDLEPDFRMGDETEVELLKMEVVEEVFSEYYEKQDKGFLTLVESYGTLKSDKAVEDMVLTLYESAMSHMNPLQWLQEVKESFLVSSVSELREQPFMQYAYKECKELLLELEEYLEIAKEICNEPGGPTPYESVLKDDIAILRTVRGGNNLDEMKQALQEKKYIAYVSIFPISSLPPGEDWVLQQLKWEEGAEVGTISDCSATQPSSCPLHCWCVPRTFLPASWKAPHHHPSPV